MTIGGAILFYVLLGIGKLAKRAGFGPVWLREFRIEKHTLY